MGFDPCPYVEKQRKIARKWGLDFWHTIAYKAQDSGRIPFPQRPTPLFQITTSQEATNDRHRRT
jgi:hypothetical protein